MNKLPKTGDGLLVAACGLSCCCCCFLVLFTLEEACDKVERGARLKGRNHVTGETDSEEGKVLIGRAFNIVSGDVACGHVRPQRGVPGPPSILLGHDTLALNAVNPLLITLVWHARVGIAIVDQDAKL